MKIWTISDTHGQENELKVPHDIDLVIHCGDFTISPSRLNNIIEAKRFLLWWNSIKTQKFLIGGNHDLALFYKDIKKDEFDNTIILDDSGIEYKGIKFFGSSWTPTFGSDRWVYNKQRGKLAEVWKNIPDDTEFLITHGPPKGILDIARDFDATGIQRVQVGCKSLANRIDKLKRLEYHAYGHIHSDLKKNIFNSGVFTTNNRYYINASVTEISNNKYNLINNGYILEI